MNLYCFLCVHFYCVNTSDEISALKLDCINHSQQGICIEVKKCNKNIAAQKFLFNLKQDRALQTTLSHICFFVLFITTKKESKYIRGRPKYAYFVKKHLGSLIRKCRRTMIDFVLLSSPPSLQRWSIIAKKMHSPTHQVYTVEIDSAIVLNCTTSTCSTLRNIPLYWSWNRVHMSKHKYSPVQSNIGGKLGV